MEALFMTTIALLSTGPDLAHRYRRNGWWRDETFLDDLAAWARVRPDAPAFVTGRVGSEGPQVVSYAEYHEHVQRYADGLYDLGVRPGDVVAFQLPDWWETAALMLACMRVGAIAQSMVPELRQRELERALSRTSARICIVVDHWAGFDYDAALAEVAPKLPHLRHRVVYGDAARTGALDFHECLAADRSGGPRRPMPTLDPDRPCLVLFTSGSTGEAKGVLHTFNTIYAGTKGFTDATAGLAPAIDRPAAALRISHIAGPIWLLFGSLLTGGTAVFQDKFDADGLLDLLEHAGATRFLATPPRLWQLIEAQRRNPRRLPDLHTIATGGATVPVELVSAIPEAFGVPVRSVWGMTEVVVGSIVRADDPPDWSAHSDGRPLPGVEFRVVTPDGRDGTGALQVRGATLCPGTISDDIGQISPTVSDDPDGWFDTGDIARPDGRGGIRIMGRVGDRIYDSGATVMIPVRDVEDELLRHPQVRDVALIACQAGVVEQVCAVVVPAGRPPTLDELREFLGQRGMTEWYFPNRLEIVDDLPRDPLGKLRKYALRERFSEPTAG
jgi:cyclohexanecarboxylate-CoA ligase